jgi:hypothetical protein
MRLKAIHLIHIFLWLHEVNSQSHVVYRRKRLPARRDCLPGPQESFSSSSLKTQGFPEEQGQTMIKCALSGPHENQDLDGKSLLMIWVTEISFLCSLWQDILPYTVGKGSTCSDAHGCLQVRHFTSVCVGEDTRSGRLLMWPKLPHC